MNDIFNENVPLKTETPAFAKHVLPAVPSSEVYLEDCVTALKRFNDNHFDLAIVDPPYGIMKQTNPVLRKAKMGKLTWDIVPEDDYWKELSRVSKNVFVFGAQYFPLNNPKTVVFWDKENHNPLYGDGELAFYFGKLKDMTTAKRNLGGVIKIKCSEKQNKIHPTQKPIKLYDTILHYFANQNDLILDTHLGSGSSRIAAYKGGFNFVGFEIDQEYYEKQEKRFNDFNSQLRLF